jgi:Protein of unknown function (DUF3089)
MRRAALTVAALVAGLALATPAAHARTVWLCKPGIKRNPCTPSLTTTRFTPAGARVGVVKVKRARHPRFDCFYVYPTVSDQKRDEATLHIDPVERSIALYQAARYSQLCRVYAPMYRQITIRGLGEPSKVTPAMRARAYRDVRDAWRTYLRRFNRGRGVVLIGHSQGTFVLRDLIAKEIDRKPAVRRRLVSAILLGGNVVRGEFKHVAPCRSRRQVGCLVAFSTFEGTVPTNSLFGRDHVICTNPAALGGGAGTVDPIFPTAPFAPGTIATVTHLVGARVPSAPTAWVDAPGSYTAQCSADHVLQVTPQGGAPALRATPDPTWGLHLVDANIALGDLVGLVRGQAARWKASRAAASVSK